MGEEKRIRLQDIPNIRLMRFEGVVVPRREAFYSATLSRGNAVVFPRRLAPLELASFFEEISSLLVRELIYGTKRRSAGLS